MQCDHEPAIRPWWVDFVSTLKTGFGAFDEPVWRPRHEHSKEVFHHTSTAAVLVNPPRIAPWRPRKDW